MESSKELKPTPKPEQHVEQDIQLCKQVNLKIDFEHSISPLRNGVAFLDRFELIIYNDERNEVIKKKFTVHPTFYMPAIFQMMDGRILFKTGELRKTVVFSLPQPDEEQEVDLPMHLHFNWRFPLIPLNNTELTLSPSSGTHVYIYHINNLDTPLTSINFLKDTNKTAYQIYPINENMLAITSRDTRGTAWIYRRKEQEFRLLHSIDLMSPDIKAMPTWSENSIHISGSLDNYLLVKETVRRTKEFTGAGVVGVTGEPNKTLLTRVSIWELDKQDRLVKTSQWQIKDPSNEWFEHFSYGPGDIRILSCKENQITICHPDITKPITTMEFDQPIAHYHILHSKKILLLHKTQQGYEIKIMQYDPLSIKEKIKNQIIEVGVNLHGGVAGIIANYVHDDIQVLEEQGSKEKPVEEPNKLRR